MEKGHVKSLAGMVLVDFNDTGILELQKDDEMSQALAQRVTL